MIPLKIGNPDSIQIFPVGWWFPFCWLRMFDLVVLLSIFVVSAVPLVVDSRLCPRCCCSSCCYCSRCSFLIFRWFQDIFPNINLSRFGYIFMSYKKIQIMQRIHRKTSFSSLMERGKYKSILVINISDSSSICRKYVLNGDLCFLPVPGGTTKKWFPHSLFATNWYRSWW